MLFVQNQLLKSDYIKALYKSYGLIIQMQDGITINIIGNTS